MNEWLAFGIVAVICAPARFGCSVVVSGASLFSRQTAMSTAFSPAMLAKNPTLHVDLDPDAEAQVQGEHE